MIISIVAAVGEHGVIGNEDRLPWHLPADLAYFKQLTMGSPIVMGRKTHESIGRPLPGRLNIVVTRDEEYHAAGCATARSFDEALAFAGDAAEVFIIGGAELFAEALPRADRIYLTRVHAEFEGDVFFPAFDESEWKEVAREDHDADEENASSYSFCRLER